MPKNVVENPPAPETDTPSAAVKSGFCRTWPPVDEKFAGRQRRAVAGEEDPPRSIRTEVSIVVAGVEGAGIGTGALRGRRRDAERVRRGRGGVAMRAARRRDLQPVAAGIEVQEAGASRKLDDDDPFASEAADNPLERVLGTSLKVRRRPRQSRFRRCSECTGRSRSPNRPAGPTRTTQRHRSR